MLPALMEIAKDANVKIIQQIILKQLSLCWFQSEKNEVEAKNLKRATNEPEQLFKYQ